MLCPEALPSGPRAWLPAWQRTKSLLFLNKEPLQTDIFLLISSSQCQAGSCWPERLSSEPGTCSQQWQEPGMKPYHPPALEERLQLAGATALQARASCRRAADWTVLICSDFSTGLLSLFILWIFLLSSQTQDPLPVLQADIHILLLSKQCRAYLTFRCPLFFHVS